MPLFSVCVSVLGIGVVAHGLFMQPEGGKQLQGLTAKTRSKIEVTFVAKSCQNACRKATARKVAAQRCKRDIEIS